MTTLLGKTLREFIGVGSAPQSVPFDVTETIQMPSYQRMRITFQGDEGDLIPAYLLLPNGPKSGGGVLIHHQHNSERHLGKSEVVGLKGNPLQAFGPALAEKGVVVLAPDSICFEDRRRNKTGTEPDGDADAAQHFNEMSYRLLCGDTLMRKVLDDATRALSLLASIDGVDPRRLGVIGHSYGGNTALFQAAIDERVAFACASGAVCSYKRKMADQTGIEMALIIPSFLKHFDFGEVLQAIAPREMLVVSADADKYSKDADTVVNAAKSAFDKAQSSSALQHKRYTGGHALTEERFRFIVDWVSSHG
jgi:cephalosporin-C deacetylase-like acetyl esterase